jgi:hypothetical protein
MRAPLLERESFSMRDAREFLAALNRPEFDDLVRSVDKADPSRQRRRNLELYRARAFALRLKGESYR